MQLKTIMNENNINFANMSNGSSNQQYNLERKCTKITGDVKDEKSVVDPKGLAKASPNFKEIPKDYEQDEAAKAKAIAENTKKI